MHNKNKLSPRRLSRSLAVQGLYYFKANPKSLSEIEDFLYNNHPELYAKANYELMHFILELGVKKFDELLANYREYSTRPLSEINPIEQVIMIIAAAELIYNLSVPTPVIINEAVELAKVYGAEDSYKFINGLVDKFACQQRPTAS